jgi:hypothetical protein
MIMPGLYVPFLLHCGSREPWRRDFETGNVSYTRFTASPYDGHEGDWSL